MTALAVVLALAWVGLVAWLAADRLPALEAFAAGTPDLAVLAGAAALLPVLLFAMLAVMAARLRTARETLVRVERRLGRTNAVAHAVESRVAEVAEAATAKAAPAARTPASAPAPTTLDDADLLRALALPRGPGDAEGFAAVRRALADRDAGTVVEASAAILDRLSTDGIHAGALTVDAAPPALWRDLAAGATPTPLGAGQDGSVIERVRARLARDAEFASDAERFLLAFERFVAGWAPRADDAALARLSDTRTARAYALIGRAAGLFDDGTARART